MSGRHQRKIRNLIINKPYQLKYIFWLSFSGLALICLNASIFYVFTKENYATLVDLSPMTDEAKTQLYQELHQIMLMLIGGSLFFLILVAVLGLIYSHRTAGPLYHFKRVFCEIAKGNHAARVRLRPKDDFQDVAKAFNEMMDSLKR